MKETIYMLITLKNVKKILGGDHLFESLNFDIQPQSRIGLVGRNGSGKTTIFKLITGREDLDAGDLFIKKHTKVGYLAQIPEFPSGTVRAFLQTSFRKVNEINETMKSLEQQMQNPDTYAHVMKEYGELQEQYIHLGGYEMDARIEAVAHGLNIHPLLYSPFEQLSGGEKTKAGLAKILLEKPEVLLLDEPTNHLDLHAIEWLEEYLKQYEGAICIISHDRFFLDQTVTQIADLENGEINSYQGNYSTYVKEKEERLLAEFKAYQEQQKKIKKMKEAIKRLRQWANEANPPNEKLFKRARNMERALERIEKLDKPVLDPKTMDLNFSVEQRSGNDVLVVEGASKSFGEKTVLKDVHLHVRFQNRIALLGDNGSGKTTLLNLLMGKNVPDHGKVMIGSQVQIGYLPQNPLEDVDPQKRLIDYFREYIRVTEGQARQILAKFLFFGYSVFHKIHNLSGGERMRLKLAVFMHQGINVLILDEPTNHLDVESQEVLEEAVDEFQGTVLCVSHDRYFLNRCFQETAYLHQGTLKRYLGNYQETKSKWEQHKETLEQSNQPSVRKGSKTVNHSKPTVIEYEKEIEQLEGELNEINKTLTLGENKGLERKKARIEEKLETYYEAWMNQTS